MMHGVTYPCAPLFDPSFYRNRYGRVSFSESDEQLLSIAKNEGIKKGHLLHPGSKIFKIVVMTKDEWPLIKSWVLYHARIFGGENLYVLDGSTNPDHFYSSLPASDILSLSHFRFYNFHRLKNTALTPQIQGCLK